MLHEDFEMAAAGNHAISKRVVEDALEMRAGICREEETGIRGRTIVAKAVCRDHSGWSFFQLRTCVAYKANIAGIRVEKVARAAALLGRAGASTSPVRLAARRPTPIGTRPTICVCWASEPRDA
jgi:IS605 OrfB family transposase